MKHKCFFPILSMFILSCISCSSDKNSDDFNEIQENDSVIVTFKLTDINVEDMPMSKVLVKNPKTVYHLRIHNGYMIDDMTDIGHIGVFTDLKYAKIRLKRNTDYQVIATALIESEDIVNLDSLKTVKTQTGTASSPISENVINNFSSYLYNQPRVEMVAYGKAIELPEYTNKSIDRYFNYKKIKVQSNEQINISLKRFSCQIQLEIDPPTKGYIVFSCDSPKFSHKLSSNDEHLSTSHIYSLGGFDIESSHKEIILKLESFDDNGKSLEIIEKPITVKSNVKSVIKLAFNQNDANNAFNLILEKMPLTEETTIW